MHTASFPFLPSAILSTTILKIVWGAHFFGAILLLPPAASWSRARHTGPGQLPLRSRYFHLGLPGATANEYHKLQHSNKVVETSLWFAAVGLMAAPQPVPLLLLFAEDFGGDQ